MMETVRHWLGIGTDQTVRYVGLRGTLPSIMLAVFVALAVVLAIVLYLRERGLSKTRRVVLTLLRAACFSLLLLLLFAPVLGLERKIVVRRNLLVLLDKSESMAIADQRHEPAELMDAALALNKTPFVLPNVQEALAGAQRAAQSVGDSLQRNDWDAAREEQQATEQSLSAAMRELETASKESDAKFRMKAEDLSRSVRDLASRQKATRNTADKLQAKGDLTNQQRCSEIRDKQREIAAELTQLVGQFGAEPTAAPPGVTAEAASQPRIALAKGLIDNPQFNPLGRAAKDFNVRYFTFGEKLEEFGADPKSSNTLLATQANAPATRGAEHIAAAVARDSSQPISGVVVMTDGAFNDEGLDPLSLASAFKEQGIPLYIVGLGLPSPRDVAVDPASLIVQEAFFPKDKITARFQVASHGYRAVATEAKLLLDGKEVGKCPIELGDDPRDGEITFTVPEGRRGPAKLELIVPQQPGEVTAVNNRVERQVRVVDQKIKVLYVEGNPRWEYRYLRVLLLRDPRLDVRFLMTRGDEDLPASSPQYLARYPEKPEEALGYDLVILGDVPAWYFSRAQLDRMLQLVRERGGSLLMLAGDRFAPSSYVDTPLAEMLPVKISSEFMQVSPLEYPRITSEGKSSFTLLENSDEANDAVWSLVRPLYRLPRLSGSKSGATVLAELPTGKGRSEPYPVIAWQRVGTGKVMYVGIDQLWRLRFKLGDHYHARFWGQAIQFLALSRLLGENKRIHLQADSVELQPGKRVELSARVLDSAFQPVKGKDFVVRVKRTTLGEKPPTDKPPGATENKPDADSTEVTLNAVSGSPGTFQGFVTLRDEGTYRVEPAQGDARAANSLDLTVAASHRERQEPALKEATLRKMAEMSGGRYLTPRDWPALAGLLQGRQHDLLEIKETDLWDSWIMFALFIVLSGSEWFIRRRSQLI